MVGVQEKIESMNEPTPEVTQKTWTDEEFMALPDDGNRYELVNGELVVTGAAGARHGYYVASMSFFLTAQVFGRDPQRLYPRVPRSSSRDSFSREYY